MRSVDTDKSSWGIKISIADTVFETFCKKSFDDLTKFDKCKNWSSDERIVVNTVIAEQYEKVYKIYFVVIIQKSNRWNFLGFDYLDPPIIDFKLDQIEKNLPTLNLEGDKWHVLVNRSGDGHFDVLEKDGELFTYKPTS